MQLKSPKKKNVIQHAVGIDITDGSLELVNIDRLSDGHLALNARSRIILPDEAITHGTITDHDATSESLNALLADAHINTEKVSIVSALPDAQVLVKVIPLSDFSHDTTQEGLNNLAHNIFKDLQYTVKKPVIRYQYRTHSQYGPQILLYITSKHYIYQWTEFFKTHKLNLTVLEMESQAIQRALIKRHIGHEKTGLIDLGYRHTTISIFDKSGLLYSRVIDSGGNALSNSIAQMLAISTQEADSLRRSVGLSSKKNKTAVECIENFISDLLTVIKSSLEGATVTIDRLILTGEGSNLRGLKKRVEKKLHRTVTLGEVWLQTTKQKNIHLANAPLTVQEYNLYAGAIGLALRGVDQLNIAKGINFLNT